MINPDTDTTASFSQSGLDPLDHVAEDFATRCRRGEDPSISEYVARFPDQGARVRNLLAAVALMEQLKRNSKLALDMSEPRPVPGRFGEFRVIRELGRGGMGVVYEAVQESLGRVVALKVVHHFQMDAKRLQRFQREAQAVAQLHHTNIVPVFAVGEQDGLPYYAMQYIAGGGLDELLRGWRKSPGPRDQEHWRFVAQVGVQASEAVQHAHEQGILHRDLKPANLLIDAHRTVWVTDFGLAKLSGQDDLTATGDVVGTLRYIAPEALQGKTDTSSDIYSLGLTLYELLTLTPPFGELGPSELLRSVSQEQPTRPRRLDAAIPRDLETIVLKATAKEPAHRYLTARAMADDLRRYLDDRPLRARRATSLERAWRWGRRNQMVASLALAAAASLILAAVVGWAGYAMTAAALRKSDDNVALSLGVMGEMFDSLVERDSLAPPPLGQTPRDGPGPGGPGGPGNGPPGFNQSEGGFNGPPSDGSHRDNGPPGGFEGPPDGDFRPFDPAHRPPGLTERGTPGPPPDGRREGPPGDPSGNRAQEDTALLRSILEFYDRFARQNATNTRLQGEAAWAYRKVGVLYDRLGKSPEAERAYGRSIEMFEDLVGRFPDVRKYQSRLVDTYDMAEPWSADPATLSLLQVRLGRARTLADRLAKDFPKDDEIGLARIHIYVKLGVVLSRVGNPSDAEDIYREAIVHETEMISRLPSSKRPRMDRAITEEALVKLLIDRGARSEAKQALDDAAGDILALASDPEAPPMRSDRQSSILRYYEMLDASEAARAFAKQLEDSKWDRRMGRDPG